MDADILGAISSLEDRIVNLFQERIGTADYVRCEDGSQYRPDMMMRFTTLEEHIWNVRKDILFLTNLIVDPEKLEEYKRSIKSSSPSGTVTKSG